MLSTEDKLAVLQTFCEDVFVRGRTVATINTDDIMAEINVICTAIDAATDPVHTQEFAANVDWITILTDLIGDRL